MTRVENNIHSKIPVIGPEWRIDWSRAGAKLFNTKNKHRSSVNDTAAMILALCDGNKSVDDIISELADTYPESADAIRKDTVELIRQLVKQDVISLSELPASASFPAPTPPRKAAKLCIGMATYDDYDGVYFSIQSIRMFHPEVLDQVEFLVVDNNPGGVCAPALKKLDSHIPNYRYVPNTEINGTAVRDFVFREANSEYVLCMDSHVLIEAGAIARLIDYLGQHNTCMDLLQGPLLYDGLKLISTHFDPVWRAGMYGTWATDERGKDADADAFEIPMQGLGLFACRKDAWLGFNPLFSGFGGEEGYIHEKFRQAGHRTLCLPFLRWLHRFHRPLGSPSPVTWNDRVRNYLIGHNELGLDTSDMKQHFTEFLGKDQMEEIIKNLEQEFGPI